MNETFTEKSVEKMSIYVYRYMWLYGTDERLQVKVLAGVPEEHYKFIDNLKNDENVKNACRVYLHEIDVALIEYYENLKGDVVEDENS